ncbi:hypothetical protein EON83_11175 [bacterium]|nr:MAG: hypothetical protein EON83_11175 [bacterium]
MKLLLEHVQAPLETAGYYQGRVPMFDKCHAIFFKCIRDASARHYQIEVLCYWGDRFPDEAYTGGIMVRLNNNTPWFIFEQHGIKEATPETIALWESRCAHFYQMMECEPYERYDELEDSPTLTADRSNADSRPRSSQVA